VARQRQPLVEGGRDLPRRPRSAHNLAYAFLYRGEAWERQGDAAVRAGGLDRAVGISPGNPAFLAPAAGSGRRAGIREAARGDYDAAIRLDPRTREP